MSHVDIWGKRIPGRGNSKCLKWESARHVRGIARSPGGTGRIVVQSRGGCMGVTLCIAMWLLQPFWPLGGSQGCVYRRDEIHLGVSKIPVAAM